MSLVMSLFKAKVAVTGYYIHVSMKSNANVTVFRGTCLLFQRFIPFSTGSWDLYIYVFEKWHSSVLWLVFRLASILYINIQHIVRSWCRQTQTLAFTSCSRSDEINLFFLRPWPHSPSSWKIFSINFYKAYVTWEQSTDIFLKYVSHKQYWSMIFLEFYVSFGTSSL